MAATFEGLDYSPPQEPEKKRDRFNLPSFADILGMKSENALLNWHGLFGGEKRGKVDSDPEVLESLNRHHGFMSNMTGLGLQAIPFLGQALGGMGVIKELIPHQGKGALKGVAPKMSNAAPAIGSQLRGVLQNPMKGGITEPMTSKKGPGDITTKQASESPMGGRIETKEFKKWFSDSMVVDDSKKPMVVYHGSGATFESFSEDALGAMTGAESSRKGFFFVDDADVAESYANEGVSTEYVNARPDMVKREEDLSRINNEWSIAKRKLREDFQKKHNIPLNRFPSISDEHRAKYRNEKKSLDDYYQKQVDKTRAIHRAKHGVFELDGNPQIYPVHLKIKNPYIIDANGKSFNEGTFSINSTIKKAKKGGHDGVIVKNLADNYNDSDLTATHYVVFKSEQIKSIFDLPKPSSPTNDLDALIKEADEMIKGFKK